MPMASQIRGILRYHDQVPNSGIDQRFTPGADIGLACLVRLDRVDDLIIELSELIGAFDRDLSR